MLSDEALRQISLNQPHLEGAHLIAEGEYAEELRQFRESLRGSCPSWPHGLDLASSPLPILVPEDFTSHLEVLGDILCRSIVSIVERWWTDSNAKFPERMPLLPHQEVLLKWIDESGESFVKPFRERKGVWRPDFVISASDQKEQVTTCNGHLPPSPRTLEGPQICEINARFAFNGFAITAFAHEAFLAKGLDDLGLRSPVDPEKIYKGFKDLLDLDKPIHLLKGTEQGLDIHLIHHIFQKRYGMRVRFIEPRDLRVLPDENSKSGFTLCCILDPPEFVSGSEGAPTGRVVSQGGEILEPIHQVALELHQRELQDLGLDVLKALAPVCFNDFRTIHLVHDKRMLGILLQELQSLVHEHGVLTVEEVEILRRGIVPTIIPGSQELRDLIRDIKVGVELKEDYLLKPVGSGKGKGIIFGSDVTTESWVECLLSLSSPRVNSPLYIVQRVVKQPKFRVIIPQENTRSAVFRYPFVGTFMVINGRHLGIGCWRTSPERICAVSHGGTWMCSLVSSATVSTCPATPEDEITISSIPRIAVSGLGEVKDSSHVKAVSEALRRDGILVLQLGFEDPESEYLLQLVHSLEEQHGHGPPLIHSSTRGWFWDVRPQPEVMARSGDSSGARSETMNDFPWHTDCSYVTEPPRFFGLHVLQADRCGGGTLSVLRASRIAARLSAAANDALRQPEFRMRVPDEFAQGTDAVVGPLLEVGVPSAAAPAPPLRCRFRADLVTPLTARARSALVELDGVLQAARAECVNGALHLTPEVLPNGSIVLLDNGRWLHARNEVRDKERHLRRIRWDARAFGHGEI